MGRSRGWGAAVTGRAVARSPGPPSVRRELQRAFWREIAPGLATDEAAVAAGVSIKVGRTLFFNSGGMPNLCLVPPSGRYLSFAEREDIAIWRSLGVGVREIARRLGRSPSTISRELRRNAATAGGQIDYRASVAQWHAERAVRRPKPGKLAGNPVLHDYVQDRLSGKIARPGPDVSWNGRRQGRRRDRRWSKAWSPEQIACRLEVEFPDDESMRISHETIYRALFVQGRGELRRELTTCLRTGRALRVPRARRSPAQQRDFVGPEVMISERPAEAEDRAVPGHWEGDLIIGTKGSAIGTLVERSTRFLMLLHLPRVDPDGPRDSRGRLERPTHGAEAVRDAIAATITTLPVDLRRSLTWDQGREMAQHAQLRVQTGLPVYFCDPHSPWQRGSNENTNGLLRQYFPKGTDLCRHDPEDLQAVADALNGRPRKTLSWRTPAEALNEHLLSAQTTNGVATTP
jgi:IS30 family transposase